ncbi:MAG: choice-of-anchor L domain-containing protein [Bacteroidetes bacterium]|nr:choice-of-anchor L domain-containing protein [Bacteroidota bacterium]
MRIHLPTITSAAVVLLTAFPALSQNTALQTSQITLAEDRLRQEMFFEGFEHQVQVCGLKEGQTYTVWAGQGGCQPKIKLAGSSQASTTFEFIATGDCMDFVLQKDLWSKDCTSGSIWFSIGCKTCEKQKDPFGKISITSGQSAQSLIQDVFIGGGCFDVNNVQSIGVDVGRGTFADGATSIILDDGVILSSGNVATAVGPNNSNGAGSNVGGPNSDPDLDILTGGSLFDVQGIEFDFQPTISTINFEYVFASEEYCEYVGTQFNDVFGFFISGPGISGGFSYNGQNIAVLPATGIFVSINNVNHITNSGYFVPNQGNCGGTTNMNDIQFDGWTSVLTAIANVIPCEVYHIRLVIADVGDGIFDSAVFLGAGSFSAGGTATGEAISASTGTNVVYESCNDGTYVFTRAGGDPNLPLVLNFTIDPGSTATPGVDYQPFGNQIVIPPGLNTFTLPVTIFNDNIVEGIETIILSLTNACSCSSFSIELEIHDPPPVFVDLADQDICAGAPAILEPTPSGGIPNTTFDYLWNTGSTASSLIVVPLTTTTYTVTVTDDCGGTASASALVQVAEVPTATMTGGGVLCTSNPAGTASMTITFTGTPPWILNMNLNGAPLPPEIVTVTPYTISTNIPGVYDLTGVTSLIGNCQGPAAGLAIIELVTIDNTVQTTPATCVGNGTMTVTPTTGYAPYNYQWSNGFPNEPTAIGLAPGNYTATVTDANGCSATATGTITQAPPMAASATATTVNCINPNNGTITLTVTGGYQPYTFNWTNGIGNVQNPTGLSAGTYSVTIVDAIGCTTTASATVQSNAVLPIAVATANLQINCNNQTIPVLGQGSSTGGTITYLWTGPGINGPSNTIDINAGQPGVYIILVSNSANGCTSTASVTVDANLAQPTATATGGELSCTSNVITLDGTGSTTGANINYSWSGSGIVSGGNTLTPDVDEAGPYTLTVSNLTNGCSASVTVNVTIDVGVPVSTIAAPAPLTCVTNSVTLNATGSSSGPNFSYQWFQNGTAIPGATGLTTPANTIGNYQLVVTNTDNGCASSFTVPVVENLAQPVINAAASGQLTCLVTSVDLTGTVQGNPGNFDFAWSTTNGNITGSTTTPTTSVGGPGTYGLLVTDNVNGCTAATFVVVSQDALIPNVVVATPGNLNCIATQVQLNGNGSSQGPNLTFTWSTTNGNFFSGQNTLTPIVDAAGTYTLTIFNSSNSCENESSVTVTIDNISPDINLPASPMLDCATTSTTLGASVPNAPASDLDFDWSTLDGVINGASDVLVPTVSAPGTYTLLVTNTVNGCTSEESIVVNENVTPPVVAIASPDVLTCTNNTVGLNATGSSAGSNFTYLWTSPIGNIVSGPNTLNPVVDTAGVYNLLITNNLNSCTASLQVTVDQDVDLPAAQAGAPMTLTCEFTELTLNGNGSTGPEFSYLWTGPGIVSGQNTLTPLVDEPGTYQLLVTNLTNECSSTASVNIGEDVVAPVAEAGTGGELSCSVTSMPLSGTGSSAGNNFEYQWTSPDGNFVSGETTISPLINASGTYFILVTNSINGCTATDVVVITEDDDLPNVEAGTAAPITCLVTQITLDGTASVTGPEFTYLWTTANGNIVSGANSLTPLVDEPGIYVLSITNTLTNCSNLGSVTVQANTAPPAVEAGPTDQLNCTETSLALNGAGSSTGANFTYEWTTQNGNIVIGGTTINPTIDAPGTYLLEVTNTVTGCTSTDQVVVTQSVAAPLAVAATPGLLTCTFTTLNLSGSGSTTGTGINYLWSTLDGNIVSGPTTLSPVINEPGTYTLLVTNNANGCTQTADVLVNQDIANPTSEAGSANQLTCTVQTITLNGNGSSTGANISYQWSTINGNIVSGVGTLTPIVDQTGTYVLTVTNSTNGCTATDNVVVDQDDSIPQAVVTQPGTLTCDVTEISLLATASQGPGFEYLWTTTGGNIISGETTLTPQIDAPGVYVLTVTNSTNGCTKIAQVTVNQNIEQPTADAGQPFIMECFEELNYLDGSGSSGNGTLAFEWATSNGELVSGSNTAAPGVSEPGTYSLVVTNSLNGCTDTDQVTITREGPVATPEATQPPCFGDRGTIVIAGVTGGESPYRYSIDNGENFGNQAVFTSLQPGVYNVIVQDANGCEFDEAVLIEQPDEFNLEVEPQVTVELGDSYQINTLVNFPLEEIAQVNWFPGFNLSCTDCLNPIATPTNTMLYTVTVETKNGCEDSGTILFLVDKKGGVYVPNAFSPNGDGTNDVFMIFSDTKSVLKVKSFIVFNRWGESVYQYFNFSPNDPAYGWDGKHRDQPMDPTVFVWLAEIEFIDGRVELFKGDVTLMW